MDLPFGTDRKIRLGIWGLGRGLNFIHSARALNIEIVAGCDITPMMRQNFASIAPDAYVTDNEDDFLAQDFDAVLIATFFRDHARHTIKALEAGKHVMCEVTSFFTPAEGVAVVEAVEKSGKVYNLLENYPFSRENLFLRQLWQEGLFGDFMYAEYDYVHECRALSYAWNVNGGVPVEPGWTVHNWRSLLNYHYYNTHSLGPVMAITGTRPVSVTATPCDVTLDGFLEGVRKGTACPSLIKMDNGGVVRNLMGSTTGDFHTSGRIWGTRASADKMGPLKIRIGGSGFGMQLNVNPEWPEMKELANQAGHGGGDFWELYYFARQILTGQPAPWDIYSAADVTLTGIMAAISCQNNGEPIPIPDFRKPDVRDQFRHDHRVVWPTDVDTQNLFPEGHDTAITGHFSSVMTAFYPCQGMSGLPLVREAFDGIRLYPHLADANGRLQVISAVNKLLRDLPSLQQNVAKAQRIADAYPNTIPGKTIRRLLDHNDAIPRILDADATRATLQNWLASL